jgi:cytochrome P450
MAMRLVKKRFQLGEYELEPETMIALCFYMLHRREDLYPDPLEFRPERFLDQRPGTYTWAPFGGGDRHCIGRSFATCEIKAVLRTLALRARLAPADLEDEEITRAGVMFSPSRGAEAVLRERVPVPQAARAAV